MWRRGPTCAARAVRGSSRGAKVFEQCIDERSWFEASDVVNLLAHTDKLHRPAHLLANRHDDAPFGGTVEFGEDDPSAVDGLGELTGLADPVLAGGGVEDEEDFVGRCGDQLADGRLDFGQFGHQVLLRLQPTGRIDNADVSVELTGPLDGSIGDTGWHAPLRAGDNLNSRPFGPDSQLFDRRGTECVGRAENHLFLLAGQQVGQFGDGGRLARAIDTADQDDRGALRGEPDGGLLLCHEGQEFGLPDGDHFGGGDDPAAHPGADFGDDLLGRLITHVGLDVDTEQLVQVGFVEQSPFGTKQVTDVGLEQLRCLAKSPAEFPQQAGWRGPLRCGAVRGGPVVVDGTVYFAAGIWPTMGVFVVALEADSGKLVWRNGEISLIENVRIDHNTLKSSALSPQGYLVVQGDTLLVPNGRSMPAGLDRKTGKLPWKTVSAEYELEYGTSAVEMHCDAVAAGQRVLLVDDLLATGGTARATCQLVERLGATVVGVVGLIDLAFLPWREKLEGYDVRGFVRYD